MQLCSDTPAAVLDVANSNISWSTKTPTRRRIIEVFHLSRSWNHQQSTWLHHFSVCRGFSCFNFFKINYICMTIEGQGITLFANLLHKP